jgi:uncharacterized protein YdeI (YjbR/CyaY-like superfamily)
MVPDTEVGRGRHTAPVGVDDRDQVTIGSREEWRAWLAAHWDRSPGIWLVTWKKSSGGPYVPYDAVVEEALAFGWVDGRARSLDERRTQLLLTPRRRGSGWSAPNKERVERLERTGRMAPPGAAVVAAAKADGSWNALDAIEALEEPADLRAALDGDPRARACWDALSRTARKVTLQWVSDARRPATRADRVRRAVEAARDGVPSSGWPPTAKRGPAD